SRIASSLSLITVAEMSRSLLGQRLPVPHRVARGCLYLAWRNVVLWRLPLDGPPRETTQPAWLSRRGRRQRPSPRPSSARRLGTQQDQRDAMVVFTLVPAQAGLATDRRDELGRAAAAPAGAAFPHVPGHRRDNRDRSVRVHGHRRPRHRRPLDHAFLRARSDWLWV